jgi:hypothetical protein
VYYWVEERVDNDVDNDHRSSVDMDNDFENEWYLIKFVNFMIFEWNDIFIN